MNKFKSNTSFLIIFILIFANILIGKTFASLNFSDFFYINEILIGLYLFINYQKIQKIYFLIFLTSLPPLFQVYFKGYSLIDVFTDYALFYYPFILFNLFRYDDSLKNIIQSIIGVMERFFPFFPLYYFIAFSFRYNFGHSFLLK